MTANPIFESSARRRMRTAKTPGIITAYLAAMLIFAVCQMTGFFGQGVSVAQMRKGMECYILLAAMQFFLILLVAPALGAGSIAGERERQTFDLLLVTGVGAGRIILGKLMESFAFLALLVLCSAPVMALVLVTGGVTVWAIVLTLLYLLAIALAALAVGMVMSVLVPRTLASVILAYLAIFALGFGTWGLAKQGPLAAQYTYSRLTMLADAGTRAVLLSMPPTIYFNPAVGLVMLLSGQTGILHRTMQETMRLYDIYSAAKLTGFTPVAEICLAATLLTAAALILLAMLILRLQTGAVRNRRR